VRCRGNRFNIANRLRSTTRGTGGCAEEQGRKAGRQKPGSVWPRAYFYSSSSPSRLERGGAGPSNKLEQGPLHDISNGPLADQALVCFCGGVGEDKGCTTRKLTATGRPVLPPRSTPATRRARWAAQRRSSWAIQLGKAPQQRAARTRRPPRRGRRQAQKIGVRLGAGELPARLSNNQGEARTFPGGAGRPASTVQSRPEKEYQDGGVLPGPHRATPPSGYLLLSGLVLRRYTGTEVTPSWPRRAPWTTCAKGKAGRKGRRRASRAPRRAAVNARGRAAGQAGRRARRRRRTPAQGPSRCRNPQR